MYSDFYEIPLPALRFEKVEETNTKWTTPKRTTPSKSTTSEKCKNRQKRQTTLSKEKQIHSQETTRKGTQTLPEQNVNKRFQNNEANDANQIRTEDLKIREIKLIHSENVHH